MKHFAIAVALCLTSCDREPPSESQQSQVAPQANASTTELPEDFEALVSGIIEGMPEDRKLEIQQAESAELMVDHFGMGMALRNGELTQRGSEVVGYLTRRGIYHRDDFSSIILLSVNRRLRGELIDLDGQIQYYRDYWAEKDVIAPLETKCPTCDAEMEIIYLGSGVSDDHPDRIYFLGQCTEHSFLYYHTDGWRPEDEVWSGPKQQGEQAGAGQPATRSESDSEGGDKPEPESEGRSQ